MNRTPKELFEDLVSLNADQWNTKLAKELNISIEELKTIFLTKNLTSLNSGNRSPLQINKSEVKEIGDRQKEDDSFMYDKLEELSSDGYNALHEGTLLDRFTVNINEDKPVIESISITGKVVVGMDLSNSDLSDSYFCHCIFFNCDFTSVNLCDSNFNNCVFNNCHFEKSDNTSSTFTKCIYIECNYDKSSMAFTLLTDCIMISCQYNGTKFAQSTIIGSGIISCMGISADFVDSRLISTSIVDTDFTDSSFRRSKFIDLILTRTDISGCDLQNVQVTCITAVSCKYDVKYSEVFKMSHFLMSPSVSEWEPKDV